MNVHDDKLMLTFRVTLLIVFVFLGVDYLLLSGMIYQFKIPELPWIYMIFGVAESYGRYIRIFFMVDSLLFFLTSPSLRDTFLKSSGKVGAMTLFLLSFFGFTFIDYVPEMATMFLYPALIVINFLASVQMVKFFRPGLKKSKANEGRSKKIQNDISVNFDTTRGPVSVPSPHSGTIVIGTPNSGKTFTILEEYLRQHIAKYFSGFLYDYKSPKNTLFAYDHWVDLLKENGIKGSNIHELNKKVCVYNENASVKLPRFYVLNIPNLAMSHSINVLAPEFLPTKMHIRQSIISLYQNLVPEFIKKKDFFDRNAINYIIAVYYYYYKHAPEYCTLPHLVSTCLLNFRAVLEKLRHDEEIRDMISQIIEPFEMGAADQLAGVIASVTDPLNQIYTKEIFWATSGRDCTLDLNNPEDPKILSICNDEAISSALNPVIGLYANIIFKMMNRSWEVDGQQQRPSFFHADEIPTIYIDGIDRVLATSREYKVCTTLGLQLYSQFEQLYQKEMTRSIIGCCSNRFVGRVNDNETAEVNSKIFGEIEKEQYSKTRSASGESLSESLKKERKIKTEDLAFQEAGHFTGFTSDVPNPIFSAMFNVVKHKKPKEKQNQLTPFNRFGLDEGEELSANNWKTYTSQRLEEHFSGIRRDVRKFFEEELEMLNSQVAS